MSKVETKREKEKVANGKSNPLARSPYVAVQQNGEAEPAAARKKTSVTGQPRK